MESRFAYIVQSMKLNNMETGKCHSALHCTPLLYLLFTNIPLLLQLLLLLPSHFLSVTVKVTSSCPILAHFHLFNLSSAHFVDTATLHFIPLPSQSPSPPFHTPLSTSSYTSISTLTSIPAALRLAIARNDTSIRNALEAFRDDSSESNLSATLRRISRQTIDDTMEEKEANRNREEVRTL